MDDAVVLLIDNGEMNRLIDKCIESVWTGSDFVRPCKRIFQRGISVPSLNSPIKHGWSTTSKSLGISLSKCKLRLFYSEAVNCVLRGKKKKMLKKLPCASSTAFRKRTIKMGRMGQEVAVTRCSRCVYLLLPLCHKEEVNRSSSCLSRSFHFTCNEVIAGGQLLTPAESFSPLVVSLFYTLHIAPSFSPGCHRAPEFAPTSSLIFKLKETRPSRS